MFAIIILGFIFRQNSEHGILNGVLFCVCVCVLREYTLKHINMPIRIIKYRNRIWEMATISKTLPHNVDISINQWLECSPKENSMRTTQPTEFQKHTNACILKLIRSPCSWRSFQIKIELYSYWGSIFRISIDIHTRIWCVSRAHQHYHHDFDGLKI